MNKKEQIAEWTQKGAEWCATQLYEARRYLTKERRKNTEIHKELKHLEAQSMVDNDILRHSNKIMSEVLEENGIRPTRLRITYLCRDCDHCDYGEWDDDDHECHCSEIGWYNFPNCDELIGGDIVRGAEKAVTESIAFYTYKIDNGFLSGITGLFEHKYGYDLVKVVDEKTGEIIGEWEHGKE